MSIRLNLFVFGSYFFLDSRSAWMKSMWWRGRWLPSWEPRTASRCLPPPGTELRWSFFAFLVGIHWPPSTTLPRRWLWCWDSLLLWLWCWDSLLLDVVTCLSTHTVYQYKILFFSPLFWGIWLYWKMDTGKHNFHEIYHCFKLSKKTEKLLNEQPVHAIAKWTLTGLVQQAKKSCRACVFSTTLLLPSTATRTGWNSKCHCQWKTKDPSLLKESTGSQTLAYGLLPKGLTAMLLTPSCVCRGTGGGRGPRRWDGRGGGGAGEGGGEGGGGWATTPDGTQWPPEWVCISLDLRVGG